MRELVKKAKVWMATADAGDKAIVVEVGLAVIAVVLLVVFRTAMTTLINDVISSMSEQIKSILTSGVGNGVVE
ncbi:MAG: hypothetical protein LUH19_01730 [Lachnospiraceae bacterium]|nr:hypothetical protein [Lachnospiraceae bacterium]